MKEYDCIQYVLNKYCQPNPIIFELGCYDGYLIKPYYDYSATKPLHYFAFEADPENFKKMLANENIPKEVILMNKAIANYTGVTEFNQSSGKFNNEGNEYDVCGSIRSPKEVNIIFPFIKFKKIQVECIKLDDFCKEKNIQHIDIILADIQGAEKNMIEGGIEIIKNIKFMFLEKCNDEYYEGMLTAQMLKDFLSDTFAIYAEWNNDIMFVNKKIVSHANAI